MVLPLSVLVTKFLNSISASVISRITHGTVFIPFNRASSYLCFPSITHKCPSVFAIKSGVSIPHFFMSSLNMDIVSSANHESILTAGSSKSCGLSWVTFICSVLFGSFSLSFFSFSFSFFFISSYLLLLHSLPLCTVIVLPCRRTRFI